jgi:hypothetical protein
MIAWRLQRLTLLQATTRIWHGGTCDLRTYNLSQRIEILIWDGKSVPPVFMKITKIRKN